MKTVIILILTIIFLGVIGTGIIHLKHEDCSETSRMNLNELGIPFSRTGFLQSSYTGDAIAVRLFIECGMNPNTTTDEDVSALRLAISTGSQKTAIELLKGGANPDVDVSGYAPVIEAVTLGYEDIVLCLIEHGANVNLRDRDGNTPLMKATILGNEVNVRELLNAAASVEIRDRVGVTPLYRAALSGNLEIFRSLLAAGANPADEDRNGRNIMMNSVAAGNKEMLGLLLGKGIDVNDKDVNGASAIMIAANIGNIKVLEMLIEAKANINDADNFGWTPLMFGVREGHYEVVKILLDNGADVKAKVKEKGYTALSIAEKQGFEGIQKLLKEAGAKS